MRHYSDSPKVDFDSAPEMAPYLAQPDGMYVGCPGKHGYLNLGFSLKPDGKCVLSQLDRRAPLIVQQELYFDEEMPEMPCVYILSSGGPNVDGDRFVQNISMAKDSLAYISTGAATKIAEMKRNYSGMIQNITLDQGAYLEYRPLPIIPCRHARFISDTSIKIHPSATLFYSEVYMAGRKYYKDGELYQFDMLSVCTHAERPDGEQLFREKFVIDPNLSPLRDTGAMNRYDVFANVLVLTPPEHAEAIYKATDAFINRKRHLAAGISHLPNGAGLLYKVLGMEPEPVKAQVREFCSTVRMQVKGHPLPAKFPWR